MILDCILDNCPLEGFVDYRKCCACKHNPLGNNQPEIGHQDCQHPLANHNPKPQRWQDMKKAAGILHLTLVG